MSFQPQLLIPQLLEYLEILQVVAFRIGLHNRNHNLQSEIGGGGGNYFPSVAPIRNFRLFVANVILCYLMLSYAVVRYLMLSYATLCYLMLSYQPLLRTPKASRLNEITERINKSKDLG